MTLHLDSKEKIASVPVLKVRDTLFRWCGCFRADWLTDKGLPARLCDELLTRGYIKKKIAPRCSDHSGFDWFDLTDMGRQFVRASAAPRIKLSSAAKTVEALGRRIEEINTSDEYMVRVTEAVIFGSYIRGGDRIGDIDFAFRTERKSEKFGTNSDWDRATEKDFRACGRIAKSFLDELSWPDMKVRLRLKNRQRTISLHVMDEFLALQRKSATPFTVLMGDGEQILTDIQQRKLAFND